MDKASVPSVWTFVRKPALFILVPALTLILIGVVGAQAVAPEHKDYFDNIHWTASYIAAACLAWVGVRFAPGPNNVKRSMAIGLTLYAIGQVLWDLQSVDGKAPFPDYSDAFFVALAPFYAWGILAFIQRNRVEIRNALLDIAGLTIAFLSLTLEIYIPRQHDESFLQMATLVAYPVGYFLATAAVLVAVLTVSVKPHAGWIVTLCALTANTVLWLRWNVLTLDDRLVPGSWFNALFSVTALALGFGALLLRGDVSEAGPWQRFCQGVLRIIPLFVVTACAIAVVVSSLVPSLRVYVHFAVLPGFGVAVLLAVIRQSLSLIERESLLVAERGLRVAEGRNKLIIETSLDAVISIGPDGRITEWNPVAEKLFQYSRTEAVGSTVANLIVPPHLREAHVEGLAAYFKTGQGPILGTTLQTEAIRKDGTTFPIEISVNVVESPEGAFFSAFIRDLTKRLEDEATRQSLETQLRHSQKMEAVGTLAAGIAHDFNNVLAAIRGNADLAAEELSLQHPARESVDEIRRAGLRASHLVQQIVAFSRRDKTSQSEPTNLTEIAYEVTRLMRSTLPPNVDIMIDAEPNLPYVMADPDQMHQVLVNLYTNAWHAIGNKQGNISVNLAYVPSHDESSGSVEIRIRDDGEGMDRVTAERIFEPFFTTKRLGEGTGLGLSVVHNIIANHSGEIIVESQEKVGTEMRIVLPALGPKTQMDTQSLGDNSRGESGVSFFPAKIAYVDDEDSLLLLLRRALSRKGHTVTGYLSAEVALEEIRGEPERFDILITDLNMPEMSGIDFAKRVRESLPDLPILLTSGFVSDQVLSDAKSAGINRVVEKPNTLDDLCAVIQEVLQELEAQRILK